MQQEGESTEDHSRFRSALPLYLSFSPLSLSPSLSFCFSPFSLARAAAAAATRRLVGERREKENTRKRARERRRKRIVARKTELERVPAEQQREKYVVQPKKPKRRRRRRVSARAKLTFPWIYRCARYQSVSVGTMCFDVFSYSSCIVVSFSLSFVVLLLTLGTCSH